MLLRRMSRILMAQLYRCEHLPNDLISVAAYHMGNAAREAERLDRVGDTAGPEGVPDPVDLVLNFSSDHNSGRVRRGRGEFMHAATVAKSLRTSRHR